MICIYTERLFRNWFGQGGSPNPPLPRMIITFILDCIICIMESGRQKEGRLIVPSQAAPRGEASQSEHFTAIGWPVNKNMLFYAHAPKSPIFGYTSASHV